MKRLIIVLITLCCSSILMAQNESFTKVEGTEKELLKEKIKNSSNKIKTLCCSFTQEKQLSFLKDIDKSSGVMYFQTPDNLRWEYLLPEKSHFIFSQNRIILQNADGTTSQNASTNRPFKMLSELIIGFVSGKGLEENANFNMDYLRDDKRVLIRMIPKQKELKKMVSEVLLYLDNTFFLANEIVISESSGDKTRLIFTSVDTNTTLAKSLFDFSQK